MAWRIHLVLSMSLNTIYKEVYKTMQDGTYQFEDKDLPFMNLVREHGLFSLPFRDLLNIINETHKKGLEVS